MVNLHGHEKNVSTPKPIISREVFDKLDNFHRAAAIVLARHGEIALDWVI